MFWNTHRKDGEGALLLWAEVSWWQAGQLTQVALATVQLVQSGQHLRTCAKGENTMMYQVALATVQLVQ